MKKLEVAKNNGNFFYTGDIIEETDNTLVINTIKGEKLEFYKDKIQQIEHIDKKGCDKNEDRKENIHT